MGQSFSSDVAIQPPRALAPDFSISLAPPCKAPAAEQAAEKLKLLSFRGTLRAEESLRLLTLEPREIPRFARNDKINYFFRSLFSLSGFEF